MLPTVYVLLVTIEPKYIHSIRHRKVSFVPWHERVSCSSIFFFFFKKTFRCSCTSCNYFFNRWPIASQCFTLTNSLAIDFQRVFNHLMNSRLMAARCQAPFILLLLLLLLLSLLLLLFDRGVVSSIQLVSNVNLINYHYFIFLTLLWLIG